MIQDLMDLRANKWVPCKHEGPKTIDAIHKEAQQEEQDRQVSISCPNTNQIEDASVLLILYIFPHN